MTLETTFTILLAIQFAHSIEELSNDFHLKFPPFRMSFRTFLAFEVLFFGTWVLIYLIENVPYRDQLMAFFNILMFANGLWHLVWWAIVKHYVPGLVTAPLFVVTFVVFYFGILS